MLGLALSGGAARGAWQGGKASVLLRPWEIVAGTSVGSVNAAHLAQYEVGDEPQAFADLRRLWYELRTKDVHRRWCPLGTLSGLWKSGLRDLSPLRKVLEKHVDPERIKSSGRKLIVGAVMRATGEEVIWTEADADGIVDAVMASCAIPFAFEPQMVCGVRYVDWGVTTVCPVEALVSAGATEVDAVCCFPEELPSFPPPKNALEAGLHAVDMANHQILVDDLRGYAGGVLNVYRPDRDLGDGLDFSPGTNAWRWELGARP